MRELLQLRELFEQTKSNHANQIAAKVGEASSELASLRSQVEELNGRLSAKESDHNSSKGKYESIIRDLKRENGSLTEQFILASNDRNKLKAEIDKLKEEARKNESLGQSNSQKTKELAERKEKAEKDLQEALQTVSKLEEELNELKNKELPEKEKVG